MNPTWNENDLTNDEMFLKSVNIAKIILNREIIQGKDFTLQAVVDGVVRFYEKGRTRFDGKRTKSTFVTVDTPEVK